MISGWTEINWHAAIYLILEKKLIEAGNLLKIHVNVSFHIKVAGSSLQIC